MVANVAWFGVDWWHVAGWTMVHFLWLGAMVGAAAALLCWLLRRRGPNARYASALGALGVLSALPVAVAVWLVCTGPATQINTRGDGGAAEGSGFGVQGSGIAAEGKTRLANAMDSPVEHVAASDGVIELSNLAPMGATGSASAALPSDVGHSTEATADAGGTPALALLQSCVTYMPWLWIVGTPLTFALLATGVIGSRRLRRASQWIDSGPVVDACARLARSLAVGRDVSLAVCERIAAPVLIGIVRPIILLPPAAITGWSPDELEMVLLHELAHVRRWDNLVNLLQRLVESLLFFHPAVWLVSAWVRREREACCDAIVVAQTQRPQAYAEVLIALAARMPRSALFTPAAASAMAAGPLRSRIRQILKLEDDPMLVSGKSLALATVVMLALVPLTVMQLPLGGRAEDALAQNGTQIRGNSPASTAQTQTAQATKDAATIELSPGQRAASSETSTTADATAAAAADPDELVFELYTIPDDFGDDVRNWLKKSQGNFLTAAKWSDFGTLMLQAPRHYHQRLKSLLDSTRTWRRSIEAQRDLAPLVKENSPAGPRARLVAAGLVFGPPAQVPRSNGGARGIEVVEVAPGSPAAWQDIKPGYIMTSFDRFHTPSLAVLEATVENLLKGFPNTQAVSLSLFIPQSDQWTSESLPIRQPSPRLAIVPPPADSETGEASQQQPSGRRGSVRGSGRRGSGRRGEASRRGARGVAEELDERRAQRLDELRNPSREANTPRRDAQITAEGDQLIISSPAQQTLDQLELRLNQSREDAAGIAEWEKIVARTPRVDATAAKMAWEKLGLKLIPASGEEVNRLLFEQGPPNNELLKIVGGNLPPGLPVPSYVESLDGQPVLNFDMLWEFVSNRPHSSLRVFALDTERNRYVFTTQPPNLENLTSSGPVQLETPSLTPRMATGPQDTQRETPAPSRSALRFEGKRFDEWRNAWRTELSAEKRLEAVKALAAFGANGYGQEAAAAILEVVKAYDWTRIPSGMAANNSPVDTLKNEAVSAFVGGPRGREPLMVAADWLPPLIEAVRDRDPQVFNFAIRVLRRYPNSTEPETKELRDLIPQIIEWTRDESLGPVRVQVAYVLTRLHANQEDERIARRLTEMLADPDEGARRIALNGLYGAFMSAASAAQDAQQNRGFGGQGRTVQGSVGRGEQDAAVTIPPAEFRPELVELLKSSPDLQMQTVSVLGLLGAKAKPAVVHLLPILLDENPTLALAAALSLESITGSDDDAVSYLNRIVDGIISADQPVNQKERARATLAALAAYREQEARRSDAEIGRQGSGQSSGGRGGGFGGSGGLGGGRDAGEETNSVPGTDNQPGGGRRGARGGRGRRGAADNPPVSSESTPDDPPAELTRSTLGR